MEGSDDDHQPRSTRRNPHAFHPRPGRPGLRRRLVPTGRRRDPPRGVLHRPPGRALGDARRERRRQEHDPGPRRWDKPSHERHGGRARRTRGPGRAAGPARAHRPCEPAPPAAVRPAHRGGHPHRAHRQHRDDDALGAHGRGARPGARAHGDLRSRGEVRRPLADALPGRARADPRRAGADDLTRPDAAGRAVDRAGCGRAGTAAGDPRAAPGPRSRSHDAPGDASSRGDPADHDPCAAAARRRGHGGRSDPRGPHLAGRLGDLRPPHPRQRRRRALAGPDRRAAGLCRCRCRCWAGRSRAGDPPAPDPPRPDSDRTAPPRCSAGRSARGACRPRPGRRRAGSGR